MRRALLITTALSLPAQAETPPAPVAIPDTIVRAASTPLPAERLPAGVTIITREQIQERGYQSLAEALASVPGLSIAATGGLGQQTSLFTRGSNSNHTRVLIDGVPVNDPSTPAGAFDFGQDLLGDIERIEVVRGPFSSLYGSGALGGAINLITRRAPADRAVSAFGELAGGSNRTVRLHAGAAGTAGAFDYLAVGQSFSSAGWDASAPRLPRHTGERDGYRAASGTVRLGWQAAEWLRVEALGRWRETNYQFDAAGREDPNATGTDRAWLGTLRAEARLMEGAWTTGLRLSRTENRRRALDAPDGFNPRPFAPYTLYGGTRTAVEWGNRVTLPEAPGFTQNVLSFGASAAVEASRTRGIGITLTNADLSSQAVFGGLESRVLDFVNLSAAFRHERVESFPSYTTWRVGAVIPIEPAGFRLHGAIGTAFRAPSLEERFGASSFVVGNPDLKPERSLAWEGGFGWRLLPQLDVGATYFASKVEELIAYDFSRTPGISRNVDRARIRGAEFQLLVTPVEALQLRGAWTVTDAFDDTTDRRLLRRPATTITGGVRFQPIPALVVSAEIRFTGAQNDFVYTGGSAFSTRGVNPSGTVGNATISYTARPGVVLFTEARNLGNTRYEPVNSYVVPGRSVLGGVRLAL